MANYFNTLSLGQKLDQLSKCRFMGTSEFEAGVEALIGKKIVIVGCGAQGLNQGLNMRDSGLDISYALRAQAIAEERQSFKNASGNGFTVGTNQDLIPTPDVVLNLTPDKQHSNVVDTVMPLMKNGATLSYSHGFNIVEEGKQIRKDLTVIMVAPKCPGSEVREEDLKGALDTRDAQTDEESDEEETKQSEIDFQLARAIDLIHGISIFSNVSAEKL